MSERVRILLADDHAILRSGLTLLLNNQPDFEVVDQAKDGAQAVALAERLQPDVLLLDLNMPEMDGLTVIQKLRQTAPETRILVLTMHEDATHLQRAIQYGAMGYVLKKAVDTELIMAIRAVLRGEIYVHPAMTQHLLPQVPGQAAAAARDPWEQLSDREFEVLQGVALGYTNAEIADTLSLSVKTIETYRARGMEKMELKTRAELVKSALEHGHLE